MPDQHDQPQTASTAAIARLREVHDQLKAEIGKIIVGQDAVIEQMLTCIFSRGHALVVGVPGLAKTLLISTIAKPQCSTSL